MARGPLQDVSCQYCRGKYGDFHPDVMGYSEAAGIMFRESQRAAARGDYSKPASRRAILGRMHEAKLAAWQEHCRACEDEYFSTDRPWAPPPEDEDQPWWDEYENPAASANQLEWLEVSRRWWAWQAEHPTETSLAALEAFATGEGVDPWRLQTWASWWRNKGAPVKLPAPDLRRGRRPGRASARLRAAGAQLGLFEE